MELFGKNINNLLIMEPVEAEEPELIDKLINDLSGSGYDIKVDTYIKFHAKYFEPLTTGYEEGFKKTVTLRYKKDTLRIPVGRILPVFEAEEYIAGRRPRGIMYITKVIASKLKSVSPKDLKYSGITDKNNVLSSMQVYYPEIKKDSWVSAYRFAYESNPDPRLVQKLLKKRNI